MPHEERCIYCDYCDECFVGEDAIKNYMREIEVEICKHSFDDYDDCVVELLDICTSCVEEHYPEGELDPLTGRPAKVALNRETNNE